MSDGTVRFDLDGESAETWYRVTGDVRPGASAAPQSQPQQSQPQPQSPQSSGVPNGLVPNTNGALP